jgi:hypothetical protein
MGFATWRRKTGVAVHKRATAASRNDPAYI